MNGEKFPLTELSYHCKWCRCCCRGGRLYVCILLGVVGGVTLLLLPLPCSFMTHRILPVQQQQQQTN